MNWSIKPLPYLLQIEAFAKAQSSIWSYFKEQNDSNNAQAFIDSLIKSSYVVTPASNPLIWKALQWVQQNLHLNDVTFEIYQQEQHGFDNASIIINKPKAYIFLSGTAWQNMDLAALHALLAHECAHYYLLQNNDESYNTSNKILHALAAEHYHSDVFKETIRKANLFTEIYCDRVAYSLLNDFDPIIKVLINISAGLKNVDTKAYVAQAQEIISKDPTFTSKQYTHPENFIRALSLHYWQEDEHTADEKIHKLITAQTSLEQLDYFDQKLHQTYTEQLLQVVLQHKWMQDEHLLQHAQAYLPDFKVATTKNASILPMINNNMHESFIYYYAYILQDFTLINDDLGAFPLAWTYFLSTKMGIANYYEKILSKEWKLSVSKTQERIQSAMQQFEKELYI